MSYLNYTKAELARLMPLHESFQKAAQQYPGISLVSKRINGTVRYYAFNQTTGKQRYLSKKDTDLLQKLWMKRHAAKAMRIIHQNIQLLNKVLRHYHDWEEKCDFVFPNETGKADSTPSFQASSSSATHPEDLKHLTSFGLRVRSKSEAIIAELLCSLHIPFTYEKPLRIKCADSRWRTLHPDFTFSLPDDRKIYLEHLGMMNDPAYREVNYRKLTDYFLNGIYPPHNLIITMDGPDGELDTAAIHQMLHDQILPLFRCRP